MQNIDLFEPLKKVLTVPSSKKLANKVGANTVYRYSNKQYTIDFYLEPSGYSGIYELRPVNSDTSQQKILLKSHGSRVSFSSDLPSLKPKDNIPIQSLTADTELVWDNTGLNQELSPDDVVNSWSGRFRFKEDNPSENVIGLRKPQLGALHSISGYFATDRTVGPATVVLPTGTGKTETMLSVLVYQQCHKVLVVVPTKALRAQIANKFLNLGCLSDIGVLPHSCELPHVAFINKSIHDVDEAKLLVESANVLVATSSILTSSSDSAVVTLCNACSHLFIDEAHHVSAKTWDSIREKFNNKRVLQFTATPFRNDGANLGGKIIYNYTMGEAQAAGYFKSIKLLPVEEYFEDLSDRSIALKAIHALNIDLDAGYDHLLMARVKAKAKADDLYRLYNQLAPEHIPVVIHSGRSASNNKQSQEQLEQRTSRIVICVDMLGEGYDLPGLKIAAIHQYHKSLAVVLQFIGRFTRVSSNQALGAASVVMNVADPQVGKELEKLYAYDANWDLVLKRLSENKINSEIKIQGIVDSLKDRGDLTQFVSLWNLHPSRSVVMYQTQCDQWWPESFEEHMNKLDDYSHAISEENNLLVVIGLQSSSVKWGTYKDLQDTNYKILIVHWDPDLRGLFVFSNDYDAFQLSSLIPAITDVRSELVAGEGIYNVFNGIEFPLARNLGASQVGAISFTQYFGPNVTDGLDLIEKSQSKLSNIAVLGYENGEKVVWGCSQNKGKVWSPSKSHSIADWLEWSKRAWSKVHENSESTNNITRNFLRPKKMLGLYEKGVPISAQWGEYLLASYEDKISFIFDGDQEIPYYLVDLSVKLTEKRLCIEVSSGELFSVYQLNISEDIESGYNYELVDGFNLVVKKSMNSQFDFADYMVRDPITIYYDDGSFSYNCWLVEVSEHFGNFDPENIHEFDWSGVNIRKESMGATCDPESIQFAVYQSIADNYDILINDDGAGEAADLVGLKLVDQEIVLSLYHCKYSSKLEPGARVADLYEVCGQAQRSVKWKHLKLDHFLKHIVKREELSLKRGSSRFLKGDIKRLVELKNRARTTPVRLEVTIVQPGIDKKKITPEMLKLLGSTSLFIKKMSMAELEVVGSQLS